jgi:hypothetical protein
MLDFVGSRKTEDAGNPIVDELKPALGANFSSWGEKETTTLHHHRPRQTTLAARPQPSCTTTPTVSSEHSNAHCSP